RASKNLRLPAENQRLLWPQSVFPHPRANALTPEHPRPVSALTCQRVDAPEARNLAFGHECSYCKPPARLGLGLEVGAHLGRHGRSVAIQLWVWALKRNPRIPCPAVSARVRPGHAYGQRRRSIVTPETNSASSPRSCSSPVTTRSPRSAAEATTVASTALDPPVLASSSPARSASSGVSASTRPSWEVATCSSPILSARKPRRITETCRRRRVTAAARPSSATTALVAPEGPLLSKLQPPLGLDVWAELGGSPVYAAPQLAMGV